MSWYVSVIGTPSKIIKHLDEQSAKETGQCKVEFDAALPALKTIVEQNFNEKGPEPVLKLEAGGSGTSVDGKQVSRSAHIKLETFSTKVLT